VVYFAIKLEKVPLKFEREPQQKKPKKQKPKSQKFEKNKSSLNFTNVKIKK
jgi:hypothetical protein